MCEEIITLNVRDVHSRNDNFGTKIWKKKKLVVLHKVGGAVEISKAGGTNNTVIPRLTTIIRSGITFVSRNLR